MLALPATDTVLSHIKSLRISVSWSEMTHYATKTHHGGALAVENWLANAVRRHGTCLNSTQAPPPAR
jgi:hypothetical protein